MSLPGGGFAHGGDGLAGGEGCEDADADQGNHGGGYGVDGLHGGWIGVVGLFAAVVGGIGVLGIGDCLTVGVGVPLIGALRRVPW